MHKRLGARGRAGRSERHTAGKQQRERGHRGRLRGGGEGGTLVPDPSRPPSLLALRFSSSLFLSFQISPLSSNFRERENEE